MATGAVELGPFAPEQGAISRWAAAAGLLGTGAAVLAATAVVVDASGATDFRSMPLSGPTGGLALLCSLFAFYSVSAYGRRGRVLAIWGAVLGVSAALTSFVHNAVQSGSLDLADFGVAYFNRDIISEIWRGMLKATANTIKYAVISAAFAFVLGLAVASLVISKRRWLRVPATIYVDVIRGLPLLMLLLLVYFGPTYLGVTWPTSVVAGIVALTINSSAYVAEIFRAGIQSVERGQMDAARSLGMPYAIAMTQVIIPQAVRRVIPPLTNEFVALVKDTSLLFILGLTVPQFELLTEARTASSGTFSVTPYMVASIMYLVITLPLIRLVTWLERRLISGEQLLPLRLRTMSHGRGFPSG